jgi:hypothetical protein
MVYPDRGMTLSASTTLMPNGSGLIQIIIPGTSTSDIFTHLIKSKAC